jgi:hypothetical protein
MSLFIFLVWLKAEQEDGATLPPAGGKVAARAGTFAPGRGRGQNRPSRETEFLVEYENVITD